MLLFFKKLTSFARGVLMANHIPEKYITTNKEAYRHPEANSAYRYYSPNRPQTFGRTWERGEGTVKWFNSYRRSQVPENVMRENLESIGIDVRPTWYSDKPDRVLGARCADREALLKRPQYELLNRIPDRERDLKEFVKNKGEHRENYKDITNTKPKIDFFHNPTKAEEQFSQRNVQTGSKIGGYPTAHRAALEHTWDIDRGPKHYKLHDDLSDFNYHKKIPEI